jgi:hypothetical protein
VSILSCWNERQGAKSKDPNDYNGRQGPMSNDVLNQ